MERYHPEIEDLNIFVEVGEAYRQNKLFLKLLENANIRNLLRELTGAPELEASFESLSSSKREGGMSFSEHKFLTRKETSVYLKKCADWGRNLKIRNTNLAKRVQRPLLHPLSKHSPSNQ